jgi:hypothetical protein
MKKQKVKKNFPGKNKTGIEGATDGDKHLDHSCE